MTSHNNFFTLFDLPVTFEIDKDALKKSLLALQKIHHPDQAQSAPTQMASLINHAHAIAFKAFISVVQRFDEDHAHITRLRDKLWNGLQGIEEIYLNGSFEHGIPNILNVSFNFIEGESLMMSLKDLAVSSGSACTSATLEPSYVLRAIGRPDELAHSSIRFSIGRYTTDEDIDRVLAQITDAVEKLRDLSPLWDMFKDGVDFSKVEWQEH